MPTDRIICVDDDPQMRSAWTRVLEMHGYDVQTFEDARVAIAAALENPPDLILLDVSMPAMDGYTACAKLKDEPMLAPIPVIFVSANGEVDDKLRGFTVGGVDYIIKPFDFAEAGARIDTQIALRRLQNAEREVLEKTLGGAVKAMVEMLGIVSPAVSERGRSVAAIVSHLAGHIDPASRWQYALAGRLCLIGCVALPEEIVEKAHAGEPLSNDEETVFRGHPMLGRQLLADIPRLEVVADIIGRQHEAVLPPALPREIHLGHAMLRVALELDQRIYRGASVGDARAALQAGAARHDPRVLEALGDYALNQPSPEPRLVRVADLRPHMILDEDLCGTDYMVLARRGMEMTVPLVAWLQNLGAALNARKPIRVLVPPQPASGETEHGTRAAA